MSGHTRNVTPTLAARATGESHSIIEQPFERRDTGSIVGSSIVRSTAIALLRGMLAGTPLGLMMAGHASGSSP